MNNSALKDIQQALNIIRTEIAKYDELIIFTLSRKQPLKIGEWRIINLVV
jgi:hypothetical protein